jgi:hypothetical protein
MCPTSSTPRRKTMADTGGFFTSLDNAQPFFKAAFEGFAGSGKTYTMAQVAIGLHKRIGSKKPIAYFDTEKAGRHLRRLFKEAGIEVLYKESRTLADLAATMKFCREGGADVLMIDSISHVYENFLQTYQQQKGRSRLQFEDWGILKPKWKREFSEPFVRDRYHALFCGRAGYEYSDEKVEDANTGKVRREIFKSGIKMKVEGETAYEPDMLVLMERFEEVMEKEKKVWREATIIKDRSTLLDGKTLKNPAYADFAPAIDYLLDDVVVREDVPETENEYESDEARRDYLKRRDIALETVEAVVIEGGIGGTSAKAKEHKVRAFNAAFGTAAWTAIKGMSPAKLEEGIKTLREYVASLPKAEAEAA